MSPTTRLSVLCLLFLVAAAAAFWPSTAPDKRQNVPQDIATGKPAALSMAWLDGAALSADPQPLTVDPATAAPEPVEEAITSRPTATDWPYHVLGALRDAQGWRVFLALDEQALTVRGGDQLPQWRVLRIDAQGLWVAPRNGKSEPRLIKLPDPHS